MFKSNPSAIAACAPSIDVQRSGVSATLRPHATEGTPYRVLGLSDEKPLFGRADAHATSAEDGAVMVPFDAQLWLRLALRH